MSGEAGRDLDSGWEGRLDVLSQRLVAAAAPLCFDVACAPADLEAVYRLRCRVAVSQGWANPVRFPDGLERDEYDARAVTVAAWDGRRLAAAARIVPPAAGERLPTEVASGLSIEPRGLVVDVGRMVIDPGCGVPRRLVFLAMAGRLWAEMRGLGYARACGSLSPGMARLYRRHGFAVEPLGAMYPSWGEERYPALIRFESLLSLADPGSFQREGVGLRSGQGES